MTSRQIIAGSYYAVSGDYQTITVRKAGVYKVDVRIVATDSSNTGQLKLFVSRLVVAVSMSSNPNGYILSMNISDILELKAGDTLQAGYYGNNAVSAAEGGSRFVMHLLQEISSAGSL
jgi:hypothetical protein